MRPNASSLKNERVKTTEEKQVVAIANAETGAPSPHLGSIPRGAPPPLPIAPIVWCPREGAGPGMVAMD